MEFEGNCLRGGTDYTGAEFSFVAEGVDVL